MYEYQKINIVDYTSEYRTAFHNLNLAWILQYFKVEEADRRVLSDPEGYILEKGGTIVVALVDDVPAGVCALQKMNHSRFDFELAKMAVSPKYQGLGIGYKLGSAIIKKAKDLGGKVLYLETNSVLGPALRLYEKLGFQHVDGIDSPYERCDVQMEVLLE